MGQEIKTGNGPGLRGTGLLPSRVAELLDARGMSKADLAKATGRSQPLISQFLSGAKTVSLDTVDKLADALGVDVADLFPRTSLASPDEAELATLSAYRMADARTKRVIDTILRTHRGHAKSVTLDVDRVAAIIADIITSTAE